MLSVNVPPSHYIYLHTFRYVFGMLLRILYGHESTLESTLKYAGHACHGPGLLVLSFCGSWSSIQAPVSMRAPESQMWAVTCQVPGVIDSDQFRRFKLRVSTKFRGNFLHC